MPYFNSSITKCRQNRYAIQHSAAYTLVELLIGLFISLFMIGVSVTYMLSSSQAFRVQSNDAFSSENARFVLEFISQSIRQAGLNTSEGLSVNLDVIYNGNRCSNLDSASNAAIDSTACTIDSLNGRSDRLAIDFVVTANRTGCNGAAVTVPVGSSMRVANVFWVGDIDGDLVRSLYCQPLNLDTNTPIDIAQPIVDGIDAMQVQYGVDLIPAGADEGDGVVDSYHSYTNLVALNPANPTIITQQVRTIRIALLVGSGSALGEESNTETAVATQFQLLDGPLITTAADRVFRQVYSTTIMLPNNL